MDKMTEAVERLRAAFKRALEQDVIDHGTGLHTAISGLLATIVIEADHKAATPPPPAGRLDREAIEHVREVIAQSAHERTKADWFLFDRRVRALLAHLDAILALQAGGVGTGWLGIESAPKDGTPIKALNTSGEEDTVSWEETRTCILGQQLGAAGAGQWGAGWVSIEAGGLPVRDLILWQPLQPQDPDRG